jgi:hypothetical protein
MATRDEYVDFQNALVDLARTGPYWAISFDSSQKAVLDMDTAMPPAPVAVSPSSVFVNEVAGGFGTAERNRQSFRDDKLTWTWEIRVAFNRHVSLTPFERVLRAGPILLPADKSIGRRQVSVHFQSSTYEHPVTQTPRTGSRATYLVNLKLWPN